MYFTNLGLLVWKQGIRVMAGSPNCCSPAEANRNETSWDLLYAAAGEVARMRMVEEAASHNPSQRLRKIGTYDLRYQQLKVAKVSI
ncbi:hypothetical protein Hanom_Chr06g00522971 [Helianthus anomalus]